ncbi:MAG: N-6 DNA methylase [Dehalococcoidia bacterium]
MAEPTGYELVQRLISGGYGSDAHPRAITEFAYEFGWRPASVVNSLWPGTDGRVNHLVVEHGLENSAVITFVPPQRRTSTLRLDERNELIGLSYNNLIDWHVFVDRDSVTHCYNRSTRPAALQTSILSPTDYDSLSQLHFQRVLADAPPPNLPALDDALMETISRWKRILTADFDATLEEVSALFNGLILTRAVEDISGSRESSVSRPTLSLYDAVYERSSLSISDVLMSSLEEYSGQQIPEFIWNKETLGRLSSIPVSSLRGLISDLYRNNLLPYKYDFSIISRHALSKIYERYVAALRPTEHATLQTSFVASLPEEVMDKSLGAYYTPEYIAKFFASYLNEHLSPPAFRSAAVADFACGSGIFLRTIAELQLATAPSVRAPEIPGVIARGLTGVDLDPNATAAARLSLALLFLRSTGRFPTALEITTSDALDFYRSRPDMQNSLDAFVVNPPYVKTDNQSAESRSRLKEFLAPFAGGRLDAYLAYLVMGVECLRPGGHGLFVIPHTFLSSDSAAGIREWLSEHAWVTTLVDLSSVRVFENASAYVVLLIIQKKDHRLPQPNGVAVVKCQAFAGEALEDLLDGKRIEAPHYSIFEAPVTEFTGPDTWSPVPPKELGIREVLAEHSPLRDNFSVFQGIVTGADKVFIVPAVDVPSQELAAYRPFLPDRSIRRFAIPSRPTHVVFYPFRGDDPMDETEIRELFPWTFAKLVKHRSVLQERSVVKRGNCEWWQPAWPRKPSAILTPKIVGPHLFLLPRFALDLNGEWLVSHSTVVTPRDWTADPRILKFVAATLNSSVGAWWFERESFRYGRGYNRVETKTLSRFPFPELSKLTFQVLTEMEAMVDITLTHPEASVDPDLFGKIDALVLAVYGLQKESLAN